MAVTGIGSNYNNNVHEATYAVQKNGTKNQKENVETGIAKQPELQQKIKVIRRGDVYGKMLVLTFEDNEDAMMNRILSLINTREEIIQMSGLNNHLLNFKGLMIDEVQRVIIRESQEIELTYTEFEILKLLAKHPGIVFSKEQIYDIVWEESYSGDYNIVMSHIRNIREKIEDNPSKPIYIQTVWGVGYRFNKNLIAQKQTIKKRNLSCLFCL